MNVGDRFEDIDAQVQRFLFVRLFTSAVVGVATWGWLAWMHVENAAISQIRKRDGAAVHD